MNHNRQKNLLNVHSCVKLARQLSMWGLITLIICLTLISAATAQTADNQNQKLEQQELETLQQLRGNRFAMKEYLRKIENERGLNAPQKDFNAKGSNLSEKSSLNLPLSPEGVDNSFNGSLSDGYTRVHAVAVQSDGKVVVGGTFPIVNGVRVNGLARLNADGSFDNGFNTGNTGLIGSIEDIKIQPDGKILIAGSFSSYNGIARLGMARLNVDGSLDQTFDPGAGSNNFIYDILVLSDGKIIVSGVFTTFNATAVSRVARLNSNGSLDSSFTPPTINNTIEQATVQSDGKVIIVGNFTSVGGVTRQRVARLNTDGSLDTSFDPGTSTQGGGTSRAVAIQPDGKILVNATTLSLIRLNTNGTVDTSFTSAYLPGTSSVHKIIVLSDGRILAAGAFDVTAVGSNFLSVVRFNSNGSLDTSFTTQQAIDGGYEVFSIALTPDGKIVAGGDLYKFGSLASLNKRIVRLNSNGTIDTGFGGSIEGFGGARAIIKQADGKIIVGGGFNAANGTLHSNIVRFNTDGSVDSSFNAGTNFDIYAVALQQDGKILIGGDFAFVNGVEAFGAARLNADGSLDTTFDVTGVEGRIYSIAVQPDGKILGGGLIFTPTDFTGIIRVNSNGSIDNSFAVTADFTSYFVHKISLLPNGQIYVGGSFPNFAGSGRTRIARLNSNGTVDNSFNTGTGANSTVWAIAQQPDGKVLIGGFFTSINGVNKNRIARLNTDGSIDSTFNTGLGFNGIVLDLTIQYFGREDFPILVGGGFSTYNGISRSALARLNADGSLDNSFTDSPSSTVYSIVEQSFNKILIGGFFTSVNGQPRNGIARLSANSDDPCFSIPISIGQSINGSLSLQNSCSIGGNPTDVYTFAGTQGQQIVISLDSAAAQFDRGALLQLIAPDGQTILAQNSAIATNARIPNSGFFTLPSTGTYTIRASSVFIAPRPESYFLNESAPQNLGNYTLSLSQQPANTTCTYAPSPTATNVSPTGGTFFFDVRSGVGCPTVLASLGTNSSHIRILSNSGGRVTFSVGSHSGNADRPGTIIVGGQTHTVTQFGVAPPTNNAFAQFETLPGSSGTIVGRNTNATAEPNEPIHAGSAASRSVWYRWIAPSNGLFSFTTSGSNFDTVMAIYTGTSVGGLTRIAENDDTTSFDTTSKINFKATAGTEYRIAVDGKNGSSGSIKLSYSPFRRLFRLYLQNFNGFASPIAPTSVTARRQDNTGQTIPNVLISLGVYEFDLPDDNSPYLVTIAGPAGIVWQPDRYFIDNTSARFNELMAGAPGGGQNQTAKAMFEDEVSFIGIIEGISTDADLASLKVQFASTGSNSAESPKDCQKFNDTGGTSGRRAKYQCVIQPDTTHQVIPSASNKRFVVPVLAVPAINTDTGPSESEQFIITASNAATFNIGGRVLANGQPLSGVVIDISSGAMTAQTMSDGGGNYVFANLAPGQSYSLKASRNGFIFQSQTVVLQSPGAMRDITAQTCAYTFSPLGNGNFGVNGGQGEFDVTATISQQCGWTAEDDSSWITINAGSSVGNGKVQFSVQPNNGPTRQGTISVGGNNFTVTQVNGCTFGVVRATGGTDVPATGGTGSFTVTASNGGCVLLPTATDYCMVNLGGSTPGNGTLNYTITNNQGVARSAVITVAGQTFTINQAAAAGTHRTKFDFDGDGKADIAVYRPSDGVWYLLRSTEGFLGVGLGLAGDTPVAADFDGDGRTDVAVYRPSNGTWYRFDSSTGEVVITRFGIAEDKPVPADYDGDGKADIAVYRPSVGIWYRLNSSTGEFVAVQFGIAEDKPVAADYDGDGKADIAVYRPSVGVWYLLNSMTGFSAVQFGIAEDKPTAADFDGDGKADIAVYRPSNGAWYRLNSQTGQFAAIGFGLSDDLPAAADYNGDKRADIAVFRPSTGAWFVWSCTNNPQFNATQFGLGTDRIPQNIP